METSYILAGIAVMAVTTYLIRVLPMVIFRKKITNVWVRSFLYYVPYVTLSVMTFPAIITATENPIAAALAFIVAILLAWFGQSLFKVSVIACVVVFVTELFL